jgi:hypothetical protein
MTFKTCATSALIAVAVLGATACKKDDSTGDGGSGGARGLESEVDANIDALKDQIKALQDLLDEEVGDVETIESALAAAQERLDALLTCENGGECDARNEVSTQLSAVTDAYCDYIFGCCSENEVAGVLGYTFSDVDACKAVYSDSLEKGRYQSLAFDGVSGVGGNVAQAIEFLLRNAGLVARTLEEGSISLDPAKVAACGESLSSATCAGGSNSCEESQAAEACYDLFAGEQATGEPCVTDFQCVDGFVCDSENPADSYGEGLPALVYGYFFQGSCIAEPEIDAPCSFDRDCNTSDGSLFCSDVVKTCQAKVEAGEACAFVDPRIGNATVEAPCVDGYQCSFLSNTCVANCEQDARCLSSGDGSNTACSDDLTCNVSDGRDDWNVSLNEGYCDAPKKAGEEATRASECESRRLFNSECAGLKGDACQQDAECRSDACVGLACAEYSEDGDNCGDDQYFDERSTPYGYGAACLEIVELNESCRANEGCEEGYCDSTTNVCTAFLDIDDACSTGDGSCAEDDFCEVTAAVTVAVTAAGPPTSAMILSDGTCQAGTRAAEEEPCDGDEQKTCAAGLVCVDTEDDGEICLSPDARTVGQYCEGLEECASRRCSDEACVVPTLEEGDTCTVDNDTSDASLNPITSITDDPCKDGLFCRRNTASSDDLIGVCTKQGAVGSPCDNFAGIDEDYEQCEGNLDCEMNDLLDYEICPSLEEDDSVCVLSDGYGMGAK